MDNENSGTWMIVALLVGTSASWWLFVQFLGWKPEFVLYFLLVLVGILLILGFRTISEETEEVKDKLEEIGSEIYDIKDKIGITDEQIRRKSDVEWLGLRRKTDKKMVKEKKVT